jgi:hypothetical protein
VVVGVEEQAEMGAQLVVADVVVAAHGRVLECAVHPLDLTIRPRVIRLGQPVLDAVLATGMVEGMDAPDARLAAGGPEGVDGGLGLGVLGEGQGVGELGAVVGQHGVDAVGHGVHEGVQEVGRDPARGLLVQPGEGELARAVDGHEQVELAGLGADLGDVEVEVADRVGLEALLARPLAPGAGQAGDAVPLQAAVQAGARQRRDRGL